MGQLSHLPAVGTHALTRNLIPNKARLGVMETVFTWQVEPCCGVELSVALAASPHLQPNAVVGGIMVSTGAPRPGWLPWQM